MKFHNILGLVVLTASAAASIDSIVPDIAVPNRLREVVSESDYAVAYTGAPITSKGHNQRESVKIVDKLWIGEIATILAHGVYQPHSPPFAVSAPLLSFFKQKRELSITLLPGMIVELQFEEHAPLTYKIDKKTHDALLSFSKAKTG